MLLLYFSRWSTDFWECHRWIDPTIWKYHSKIHRYFDERLTLADYYCCNVDFPVIYSRRSIFLFKATLVTLKSIGWSCLTFMSQCERSFWKLTWLKSKWFFSCNSRFRKIALFIYTSLARTNFLLCRFNSQLTREVTSD